MFAAVLDTCVLYPPYLRDTLLRLADVEMYAPLWSTDILDELSRNLQSFVDADAVDHLIREMSAAFPDACVTDYAHLIDDQTCEKKDRHVVAAAVAAGAGVIVTANVKDFPNISVKRYDIEVKTPDEFLLDQLDLSPRHVMRVLEVQSAEYMKPKLDVFALLKCLSNFAPSFVEEVRRHT